MDECICKMTFSPRFPMSYAQPRQPQGGYTGQPMPNPNYPQNGYGQGQGYGQGYGQSGQSGQSFGQSNGQPYGQPYGQSMVSSRLPMPVQIQITRKLLSVNLTLLSRLVQTGSSQGNRRCHLSLNFYCLSASYHQPGTCLQRRLGFHCLLVDADSLYRLDGDWNSTFER